MNFSRSNEMKKNTGRNTAIDGLRTIAILLMIASHTSRLVDWSERREWSRWVLLIEPLTASLFLMLVGASLVFSWQAFSYQALFEKQNELTEIENASPRKIARGKWYQKQALRALMLWVISCVFYTVEEGFHLPDALLLSGILATISYTIILGMILVSVRFSIPILFFACSLLFGYHLYLDHSNTLLFMITLGNSPLMPLFLFACLGALLAKIILLNNRYFNWIVIVAACLVLAWIFHRHPFEAVFTKPLGRYEMTRTLISGNHDIKIEKKIPYYNLRPILVPTIASIIILLYAVLTLIKYLLSKCSKYIFVIGKRSLEVYILHLSLLALLVLHGGMRPLHQAWQGDLTLVLVIGTCYLWSITREKFKRHS